MRWAEEQAIRRPSLAVSAGGAQGGGQIGVDEAGDFHLVAAEAILVGEVGFAGGLGEGINQGLEGAMVGVHLMVRQGFVGLSGRKHVPRHSARLAELLKE